jgi:hypothetical protein
MKSWGGFGRLMPLAQEDLAEGHDNAHKSQFVEHLRTGVGHVVYGLGS